MPSFTYNTNIPAAANLLSDDQPNLAINTNSVSDILGGDSTVDMIGFGDANGGWHRKVTYINQGSNPGSASTQYVLYSKQSGSQSELFVQKDGTATPIQVTRGVPRAATSGYSYLPGGMLIQWVQRTSTGAFSWPTPFTTACYGATLGYNDNNYVGIPNLTSITTTGAVLSNSSAAIVFIIAIGT
jgi:hypothetical protein